MVRQHQVVVHPDRLRAYGVTLEQVRQAIEQGGGEAGGSVIGVDHGFSPCDS